MKWLKRIVIGIIAIVAALAAVSFLLPGSAHVERSLEIAASPSEVFPLVNDLRRTQEWSPWANRDPEMTQEYTGPDQGVGQKVAWQSDHPEVGSGTQTIVASETDRHVKTALDFGDMGAATAEIDLAPAGSGTSVTWSFDVDLGMNPVMRYMGLMFDGMIGPDYERGLASLKALVESQAGAEN